MSERTWAECRVLFVPGAFGNTTSGMFLNSQAYFSEYEKYVADRGCKFRRVEFPEDVTIEVRARILRDVAERWSRSEFGETPLVLIAHSQGGLDARFALKSLGLKNVSALLSIGVPHHGTRLADWVIRHRSVGSPLYWVLRIFGNYDLRALSFVGEMTEAFLEQRRDYFSQVPGVRYASAVCSCKTGCHWSLRVLDFLSGSGGIGTPEAGDGIMSAETQRFGEDLGEYDLDHISEVSMEISKKPERARLLERISSYLP